MNQSKMVLMVDLHLVMIFYTQGKSYSWLQAWILNRNEDVTLQPYLKDIYLNLLPVKHTLDSSFRELILWIR